MRAGRKRKAGYRQPNGQLSRRYPGSERREGQAAVYIIEIKEGVVKIGHSACPQDRVRTLQDGQLEDIKLLWCLWMPLDKAREVEELVHRKLKASPIHLKGEMYYFDVDGAAQIIFAAMQQVGVKAPVALVRPDLSVVGGRYSCSDWLTRLG